MNEQRKRFRSVTVAESKAVDVQAGIYEVWITREVVDRTGDLVIAAGAVLDNFKRNPVVQWAHRYDLPPVAKSLDLTVQPGVGIKAVFEFAPAGASQMADEIHQLWKAGFINASSIGFHPIKSEKMNEDDDDGFLWWRPPLKFLEWELMEFSLVPVPANQEALRRCLKYLMTPEQRRREKRRVKERIERSERIALAEPVSVRSDSELLLSLSELSESLQRLKGVFEHGRSSQGAV